jgi:Na+-transporting methylmalonyl-CoA/oxaloacetate decarboxylase gamma subunit
MKTIFKKIVRMVLFILLLLLALMGGIVPPPRRMEQDYDNETKTELVEAKESDLQEEKD